MSISRGRRSFTGLPVWLAASAAAPATHEALLSLPPKPPPSAAHHRRHLVEVAAQQAGADVLDLGRMLGRGMHDDVAVLARQGEGDLAFEIEMLLPADAELGAQRVRRRLHRGVGVAAQQRSAAPAHRPWPPAPSRCRGWRVPHRSRWSRARRHAAPRRASSPRPAPAAGRRTRRGRRRTAARRCRRRRRRSCRECRSGPSTATTPGAVRHVELLQPAVRHGAQHQRGMQGAGGLRHVVDIERLAGGVLQRRVVALRGMDAALHSASTSTGRCGSARRSSSRRSRLVATCRR